MFFDENAKYLYDAEGHVCAVETWPFSGGVVMVQYLYDASGERAAKGTITSWSCDPTTNGFVMTNQYLRGPGGEQMTELVASGPNMAWEHTNIYAAGSLSATYQNDSSGPHFRFSDWLGTMRAQTNYAGVPEQTCASLPFGDGPPCTSATEQFFTGKGKRHTSQGRRRIVLSETRRVSAKSMLVLSIVTMLAVALFKVFWLVMGVLALDGGPMPKIYVINLVQAPTYLVSALTAWKWPCLAELVAGLSLVAIFTKIIPPPIFPYHRYLDWEYAFIVAANVAFFAAVLLRATSPD